MLDKLGQLNPIVRLIVGVVLAAVISAGLYFGVYQSQIEANTQAQAEVDKIEAELKELRTYTTKLNDLERQIASLQMQIELQKKIVPDEKNVDNFIHLMQDTAAATGVGIRKYVAKGVQQKEFYTEVPFEMEVDGPFYQVLSFFDRVGKLERIINVSGLEMGSLTGKGGTRKPYQSPSATVTAKTTASTFFSRESAAAIATAPAAPAKK